MTLKICVHGYTPEICIECKQKQTQREEVVRPELIARWREWGVPEENITQIVRQRKHATIVRAREELITLPEYAYRMPRLPEIEAKRWGFAKAIDLEGTIIPRTRGVADRIRRTDKGLYRYEYHRPRVAIATSNYEPIEELANMMHISVLVTRTYRRYLKRYLIMYEARASTSRAIMICYLIEPYLKIPRKKQNAQQILQIYKQTPEIRIR